MNLDLFADAPTNLSGATFSPDRKYRYMLARRWRDIGPLVAFVMLNPSTADETQDDPTIRRCIGYAKAWGYAGLVVGNLFALRSTDPSALALDDDPIGPENDKRLRWISDNTELTVCAWGTHRMAQRRWPDVAKLLRNPHLLRATKEGYPAHPLYLPKSLKPIPI